GLVSLTNMTSAQAEIRAGALCLKSRARWVVGLVLASQLFVSVASAQYPSKIILGLRKTCMDACQEKEGAIGCARYCDCHLFELRRDITDSQLEQLLLTAERGGAGEISIRDWIRTTALMCEKRVFKEKQPAEVADDKPDGKPENEKSAEPKAPKA
ncbi:MAG: hypothetical protein ACI9QQ_002656, partial [Myxococcota bacterium]